MNISSNQKPVPVSISTAMNVSVVKMQQDQQRAEGDANTKLIDKAAEVQMTGKGRMVDETA